MNDKKSDPAMIDQCRGILEIIVNEQWLSREVLRWMLA